MRDKNKCIVTCKNEIKQLQLESDCYIMRKKGDKDEF